MCVFRWSHLFSSSQTGENWFSAGHLFLVFVPDLSITEKSVVPCYSSLNFRSNNFSVRCLSVSKICGFLLFLGNFKQPPQLIANLTFTFTYNYPLNIPFSHPYTSENSSAWTWMWYCSHCSPQQRRCYLCCVRYLHDPWQAGFSTLVL